MPGDAMGHAFDEEMRCCGCGIPHAEHRRNPAECPTPVAPAMRGAAARAALYERGKAADVVGEVRR